MVHKYKVFPVGKGGQRKFKKQYSDQANNSSNQNDSEIPKPNGAADMGAKAAHIKFLNILGNNARSQMTEKGGRKTRIDPLSLKKITDNLLRDMELKSVSHPNNESTSEEYDSDTSEAHSDNDGAV